MGQLYLIRHGKTALNGSEATDRIRGWADVPLDATGRAQGDLLAAMFESKGLDDLYSSDLSRASDTADKIAAKAGLVNCPQVEFRPWNLGDFQGQESADVAPELRHYVLETPTVPVPNGESFQDFEARFLPAFEKLLDEAKTGKTVGLVTHYRCVKLAQAWLANGQADQLAIKPEEFLKADLEPADVLCVYWDAPNQRWQVEEENAPGDTAAEGDAMREKAILCELGDLAPGETVQRIQVYPPPGDYNHPKAGPFTITRDDLDEFAADINSRDNIPIDRDHAFAKGLPAPAAGWFKPGSAEASDLGVTAEVQWTLEAAQQVAAREYRFLSPEFSFSRRDMASGRRIPEPTTLAATLTNRPFFETMLPVAAEVSFEDDILVAEAFGDEVADTLAEMSDEQAAGVIQAAMTKVGAKPGQAAHTAASKYADPGYQKDGRKRYALDNEKEVRAAWSYINQAKNSAKYQPDQLKRVKARIKRAMKKLGITIGADNSEGGNGMDLTAELADKLGIAADASEDEVAEAIANLAAENATLKEKESETGEQMKTLLADAAKGVEASQKLATMERDTVIAEAIRVGKIAAGEKEAYEGFWAIDAENTAKLLAEKPAAKFEPIGRTDARVYGADGQPLKVGEDGEPITADLTPVLVDGVEVPIDVDSARITAAAHEYLRSQGKANPTDEEFFAACEAVLPTLGIER